MTQQDPNDFLMGGGSANPAWKFDDPGTTHTGTVVSLSARQEREYVPNNPGGGALKFFPSGDPIMGVHVEVQTDQRDPAIEDDNGRRTFYVEGRYLKEAVRNAVLTAGAKGLEPGGRITVTFTHREDPMDKRSRKFWNVQYLSAASAQIMTPPAAQPAPAPAAVPQQAPAAAPQYSPEVLAAAAALAAQQATAAQPAPF